MKVTKRLTSVAVHTSSTGSTAKFWVGTGLDNLCALLPSLGHGSGGSFDVLPKVVEFGLLVPDGRHLPGRECRVVLDDTVRCIGLEGNSFPDVPHRKHVLFLPCICCLCMSGFPLGVPLIDWCQSTGWRMEVPVNQKI